MVGQGNKIELWNETRWDDKIDQALGFDGGDALPPELEGFTL
jgi:Uncharacterized protein conserved in bacteria